MLSSNLEKLRVFLGSAVSGILVLERSLDSLGFKVCVFLT